MEEKKNKKLKKLNITLFTIYIVSYILIFLIGYIFKDLGKISADANKVDFFSLEHLNSTLQICFLFSFPFFLATYICSFVSKNDLFIKIDSIILIIHILLMRI